MREEVSRLGLLIGDEGIEKLQQARVAVFGLGGVGGHAAEALARSGVGQLDIFDADTVSLSNMNRQIVALKSTVNKPKAEVLAQRLADAAPLCSVHPYVVFYTPDNAADYPLEDYDFVLDCVDNVTAKLTLLERCSKAGVPIITCMGTGNKLHPERLRITELEKTSICPLARVMRRECRQRRLFHIPAVWTDEPPLTPRVREMTEQGKPVPGSTAFVPAAAGMLMASYVLRKLAGIEE